MRKAPPSKRIWIVCPSYLDTEAFTTLRKKLLEQLAAADEADVRFLLIDDSAGRDASASALGNSHKDVEVLLCPFNLGHQRALVFGLRKLLPRVNDGDTVVTMDADGEDRPQDVPALLRRLESEKQPSIVLARRTKRHESPGFKVMYLGFKLGFRLLTGKIVRTGNFAAYSGATLRRIIFHPHFDLCYSSTLLRLHVPAAQVACSRGRRYAGRSRMNFTSLVIHGIRMLMPFLDQVTTRVLIGLSASFAGLAALSLVLVTLHLAFGATIPGWIVYATVVLMILSFGAIGNFLVLFAVFSQSQGLALSQIDQTTHAESREPS